MVCSVSALFYPGLILLGLIIGSFVNVCIWRIPREESIIFPSSHCPQCNTPIRFYDNIPLVSYIILKGRCRYCGEPISWQYPFVEALTAFFFILVGWRFGPSWLLIPYLAFAASLLVISFIDLKHYIIPDSIALPGIALGFIISFFPFMPVHQCESSIGIVGCGVGFYIIAELSQRIWKREGLGGGDITLIQMIAAFLGWKGGIITIFLGSLLGSLWGLFLILSKKKSRMDIIPFGPFLCLGAFISLLYGQEIIWWYQGFFWF